MNDINTDKASIEELRAWYLETVGYDPVAEDGLSDGELRDLVRSYIEERSGTGYKHDVLHTGGNIYNDYISDFDDSGRVIVASESGLWLYANDRDYQLGCEPMVQCYVSDEIDVIDYDDESHVEKITDRHPCLFVRHRSGVVISVLKESEGAVSQASPAAACADCGTAYDADDIGTTCRTCGRGIVAAA